MRDELLNREIFDTIFGERVITEQCRKEYNQKCLNRTDNLEHCERNNYSLLPI